MRLVLLCNHYQYYCIHASFSKRDNVWQVLLQWEGFDESQVMWKDYVIKENNPNFNLEDKVDFNGEGNVTEEEATGAIKEAKHAE